MVISIRRSRHEEGEELVAIWCRSVDATHDFLSAEYRAELEELVRSFLPEALLWVAVNERDRPVGFLLLSGQHMDALFIDPDARLRRGSDAGGTCALDGTGTDNQC